METFNGKYTNTNNGFLGSIFFVYFQYDDVLLLAF